MPSKGEFQYMAEVAQEQWNESSYSTENTRPMCVHYKHLPVNTVQGNKEMFNAKW
jgi:hypothetical protein